MEPDPLVWRLFLQAACLLLAGALQAADTALKMLNPNRSGRDAEDEDLKLTKRRELSEKLRQSPSGLSIAIVFLGLLMSAVFRYESVFQLFDDKAGKMTNQTVEFLVMLAFFVLNSTVFVLFSLVFPKELAKRRVEQVSRVLYPLAKAFHALFSPLAWVVNRCTRMFLRLSGYNPDEEVEKVTEDEIRMLVDEGEEKGVIEEAEREMIENVFEFNNMIAADCMTHRTDVYAVWSGDSDDVILKMIEETGLSRFPVYQEDLDHIIGTITTRDYLMNRLRDHPKSMRSLLRTAHFVPETVRTDALFRDMQRRKYHMAVVVDEYGGTSGLITMEDLLEEIVGNIYDEYDPQIQQEITKIGEGLWRVAGAAGIETFNDVTGFDLSLEEDYDTIGGLILSILNAIPEEGTHPEIDFEGLHFRVLSVADRRIEWVEIKENDV